MKKYLIVLSSALLFTATAAMADPPQWRGQDGQQGQNQQDDHGKHDDHGNRDDHGKHDKHDKHGDQDRHYTQDNRGYRSDRDDRYQYDHSRYVRDDRGMRDNRGRYYVGHDHGRHEGWYKRGGYLPVQYREDRYYVTDWRAHRLYVPPRGYRWVRSDNDDFLLVAIATGVITNIILSN